MDTGNGHFIESKNANEYKPWVAEGKTELERR